SGDLEMQAAYHSGDFYLTFAKMAGAVPVNATKQSHAVQREQFKTVALGVLYGLSAEGLARKLNVAPVQGRDLLRMHREPFSKSCERPAKLSSTVSPSAPRLRSCCIPTVTRTHGARRCGKRCANCAGGRHDERPHRLFRQPGPSAAPCPDDGLAAHTPDGAAR